MRAALMLAAALQAPGGAADRCEPARETDAAAWLVRAEAAAMGTRAPGPMHLEFVQVSSQAYQSDRMYPPYLLGTASGERWYDPATGVERRTAQPLVTFGSRAPVSTLLSSARATYGVRDTLLRPLPQAHSGSLRDRPLNPWAVLHDWRADRTVRVAARCWFHDYWRLVLARTTPAGEERLYLDPKTALPVKLERIESDQFQLWGPRRVEFVYSTWIDVGGGSYPYSAARMIEGETEVTRTVVPSESTGAAPSLALPDSAPDMGQGAPMWPVETPDTVRVGAHTYLLVTQIYTNTVTLARDTVFILDAQWSGERRARADSTWISKLFPGRHPVVLVVSDLAWPHISGVRYWVANGATVVSHRASRAFLEKVLAHRWTAAPDLYERRRAKAPFRFIGVSDSLTLAGGMLHLYPIDGISSEASLMTWLPGDKYLYAGDYIQTVKEPSSYAREVLAATQRVGIRPERTAAMHLPLTQWDAIERVLATPVAKGPSDAK